MKTNALLAAALVASTVVIGGTCSARADANAADQAEMAAALAAHVSMTDAIQAAEAKSGGRAMEAVFTDENGKPGYEVTTVTQDQAEHNLFVDAATGDAVTATAAAENEHDDNDATDDSDEDE